MKRWIASIALAAAACGSDSPAGTPDGGGTQNTPPVLTLAPATATVTGTAGNVITITASATDADGDPLTFTAPFGGANQNPYGTVNTGFGSEPVGGAFNPTTHVFTLGAGVLGDFGVTFGVSDGHGAPVTQTVTVHVNASPVRLNEVQIGTGASDNNIELVNTSGAAVTIAGWQICVPFQYYQFPAGASIAANGFVVLHWNQTGTDTATNFFTGAVVTQISGASAVQQIVLFDGTVHSFDEIIDFVRWGTGGGAARVPQAVAAHQWPNATDVVNTGGLANAQSIARTPGANTEAPADWYVETSPTIGAANVP